METAGIYRTYEPSERQKQFHSIRNLPPSTVVVKGAIGGLSGGKSTACEQEQALICLKTPGGLSVATRQAVTKAGLSVLEDYHRLLSGVAKWVASRKMFEFDNGHKLVVCPADEWDRFGSTQLVSFYIQEAQEVDFRVFDALTQRLRDPLGIVAGVPYYTGLFDARGVKTQHWIYNEYVKRAWDASTDPATRKDAISPDWTWLQFKTYDNPFNAPGYLENQLRAHKDNTPWVKMLIEGEFGFDIEGRPVYECYKPEIHDAHISEDRTLPMYRGWDFGYNRPAVVWCQYDRNGRFLVLRELCPTGVSRDELCDMVSALQKREFPDRHPSQYKDFGDAAGDNDNTSGRTDIEFVENYFGTNVEYRRARVSDGLEVVRGLMTRMTKKGEPRFAVDVSCQRLREALAGAYYYKIDKTDERPVKGEGYDDVADALRYVAQLIVEENFGGTLPRPGWHNGAEKLVGSF